MTTEQDATIALGVVARKVLADLVLSEAPQLWEQYPELGEHDWMRVLAMLMKHHPAPEPWRFREAWELLAARAEVAA